MNLIGPEAKANLDAHITEAITAADELLPRGEVLDFGSGGGLPGIPMAIVSPEATFHLVESDQRKASFLKFAVRECGLNSVVHGDRLARVLETLDPALTFSLIISRGVGYGETWIPPVAARLEPAGRVGLFQRGSIAPPVAGFHAGRAVRLPRGEYNYLVVLQRVPRGTA